MPRLPDPPKNPFRPDVREKLPLEMLLQRIGTDLFLVFAGNGYKDVGFTLIVQDLTNDSLAMSGNLRPAGLRAVLTNALATIPEEDDDTPRVLPS